MARQVLQELKNKSISLLVISENKGMELNADTFYT